MTTEILSPAPAQQGATSHRGPVRRWIDGWGSVLLLVTGVVTAPIALVLVALVLAGVLLLSAAGVGLALLVPMVWLCGLVGHAERHRLVGLTGRTIYPPARSTRPVWWRLFLDEHNWRSVCYLVLHGFWGMLTGVITLAVLAQSIVLVALPAYAWRLPEEGLSAYGLFRVDGTVPLTVTWSVSLVVLLLLPVLAHLVTNVDVVLGRWLLGRDQRRVVEHLSARVDTLTDTRREAVDSVEAERRRIERDLHDGPQQRLVAIAMTLGMAKEAIHADPEGAAQLVDEAHRSAKEAIVEMRHVARGIVPPILADRGLEAALPALAARSTVPVSVDVAGIDRVDPTTEAIAYFVVSEALNNVAKHSGADRAEVTVTRDEQTLTVLVGDDGRGGADPSRGTGLNGLRQRVGAVDGSFTVHSPPGGPTHLTATIPLRPGRSLR